MINSIPEKLIPIFNEHPEYLLPANKVCINSEMFNSTIHIKIEENSNAEVERIVNNIFQVLLKYSINIEREKNEMFCCFISLFKMDEKDLAKIANDCMNELKVIDNIYIGMHLGKMKALQNPNGYEYPTFEGEELKIGMIMADLAKKMNIKSIASENIIFHLKEKNGWKYLNRIKLKNGNYLVIYN